jgi:hypothetical protein
MEGEIQIPGESKDRIVKEAYKRIEAYEAGHVPTEQALTEIMAWLVEQDEVEDTKAFNKTDLTVRFVDGTQIGILLGRRQAYGPSVGQQGMRGGDAASKPGCDQ